SRGASNPPRSAIVQRERLLTLPFVSLVSVVSTFDFCGSKARHRPLEKATAKSSPRTGCLPKGPRKLPLLTSKSPPPLTNTLPTVAVSAPPPSLDVSASLYQT